MNSTRRSRNIIPGDEILFQGIHRPRQCWADTNKEGNCWILQKQTVAIVSSDESSTEISDENDMKGKLGCTKVARFNDDDLDHPHTI